MQLVAAMVNAILFTRILSFLTPDKNTDAMAYLSRTNDTIEWICNFYMQYTAFVVGINLILVPTSALVCWLEIGHFDSNYALHVSKIMSVKFFVRKIKSKFRKIVFKFRFLAVCLGTKRPFSDTLVNKSRYFPVAEHTWSDWVSSYCSLCRFACIIRPFAGYLNISLTNGTILMIKVETMNSFFAI